MGKRKRGVKKRRLESKAKMPQSSRKVGILCHSMIEPKEVCSEAGYYEVKLYVVDADLKSPRRMFKTATPAVRFIFPTRSCIHAVCVLKSTVYIFGGYHPYPGKPSLEVKDTYARKFALTEDILSCEGNFQVKEEKLARIPDMNYPKAEPLALPTPNGAKILVFATHVVMEESSRAFELYDPVCSTWEKLPGLPYNRFQCDVRFTQMRCYSFIDEFHFFLELESGVGSFVLDLREKKWASVDIPSIPQKEEIDNFVIGKSEYALTSGGEAYRLVVDDGGSVSASGGFLSDSDDLKTFVVGHQFRLSGFPPPNFEHYRPSIVRLHPNNFQGEEVCETCILQIEIISCSRCHQYQARLLLDVCSTELTPLMRTTVSNRVSLHIDFLKDIDDIVLISL